jgi:Kef-type K+ transport system membrane component KefB
MTRKVMLLTLVSLSLPVLIGLSLFFPWSKSSTSSAGLFLVTNSSVSMSWNSWTSSTSICKQDNQVIVYLTIVNLILSVIVCLYLFNRFKNWNFTPNEAITMIIKLFSIVSCALSAICLIIWTQGCEQEWGRTVSNVKPSIGQITQILVCVIYGVVLIVVLIINCKEKSNQEVQVINFNTDLPT